MNPRIYAIATAIAIPARGAADTAPAPSPVPSPSPTALFDTLAPIPYGTPCPNEVGEVRQAATYTPHIEISAASRAAFSRENAPGNVYVRAFLFTYLDGHNVVLVRNRDNIDAELRAALHAYGSTIRTTPVIEGCPHLGGVFAIIVDVATGDVRLLTVSTDTRGHFS